MVRAALDLVFPSRCVACGRGNAALCSTCQPTPDRARHMVRAGLPIAALDSYDGALRRAILMLKRGRRDVVPPLAALLAGALDRAAVPRRYAIVPVPTTRARSLDRGFDQGLLLARALAEEHRRFVLIALHKTPGNTQRGRTRAQRLLAHRRFECVAPELLTDVELVLVDDVVTTGATLGACAATLRAAGARVRGAFVLAYA